MLTTLLSLALACTVVDGDTIKHGKQYIRLLGIDAPEKPGTCRKGRVCVPGDYYASKASLREIMRSRPITIRRVGKDVHRRTLAVVYAGSVNTSCYQVRAGHAFYVRKWDNGGRVRGECAEVLEREW